VGRLDNIIRRNRRGGRPTERTMVSIGIGLVVLLILFLAVFTDLGRATPDHSLSPPPPSPPSSPRPDTHDKDHVDGVYLGR
jgi:hypothetical protein